MGNCSGGYPSISLHGFFSLVENYESYICLNLQVEVSGGRGRPPTIVDSDEGLGKVLPYHPFFTVLSSCLRHAHVNSFEIYMHTNIKKLFNHLHKDNGVRM